MGVTGANNGELRRRARDNEPFSVGEVIGLWSVVSRTNNRSTELLNGRAVLKERHNTECGASHGVGGLVELAERKNKIKTNQKSHSAVNMIENVATYARSDFDG